MNQQAYSHQDFSEAERVKAALDFFHSPERKAWSASRLSNDGFPLTAEHLQQGIEKLRGRRGQEIFKILQERLAGGQECTN